MILAVPETAFENQIFEYALIDWKSWKLERISRSSLNAETQGAATAADALEYCHRFVNLMYNPKLSLRDAAHQTQRPSALVIDAKIVI